MKFNNLYNEFYDKDKFMVDSTSLKKHTSDFSVDYIRNITRKQKTINTTFKNSLNTSPERIIISSKSILNSKSIPFSYDRKGTTSSESNIRLKGSNTSIKFNFLDNPSFKTNEYSSNDIQSLNMVSDSSRYVGESPRTDRTDRTVMSKISTKQNSLYIEQYINKVLKDNFNSHKALKLVQVKEILNNQQDIPLRRSESYDPHWQVKGSKKIKANENRSANTTKKIFGRNRPNKNKIESNNNINQFLNPGSILSILEKTNNTKSQSSKFTIDVRTLCDSVRKTTEANQNKQQSGSMTLDLIGINSPKNVVSSPKVQLNNSPKVQLNNSPRVQIINSPKNEISTPKSLFNPSNYSSTPKKVTTAIKSKFAAKINNTRVSKEYEEEKSEINMIKDDLLEQEADLIISTYTSPENSEDENDELKLIQKFSNHKQKNYILSRKRQQTFDFENDIDDTNQPKTEWIFEFSDTESEENSTNSDLNDLIEIYDTGNFQTPKFKSEEVDKDKTDDKKIEVKKVIQEKEKIITISDFEYRYNINKGAYGRVDLFCKNNTNDKFAIKTVSISDMRQRNEDHLLENEVTILTKLNHPCLVNCYYILSDENNYYFVMEPVYGGDLDSIIKDFVLKTKIVQLLIAEVSLALDYLHNKKIIHRDIKPANILLNEYGHFMLADFGLSEIINIENRSSTRARGTYNYWSKEVIEGEDSEGEADYWALGIILYMNYTRKFPFEDENYENTLDNIINHRICFDEQLFGKNIDPNLFDLIKKMLAEQSKDRIKDLESMKNHAFFKDFDWDNCLKMESPLKAHCYKNAVEHEKKLKEYAKKQKESKQKGGLITNKKSIEKLIRKASSKDISKRDTWLMKHHHTKITELINHTNTKHLASIVKRKSVKDNFDLDEVGTIFLNFKSDV